MTSIILNGTELITLSIDPQWQVPTTVRINEHNYETRRKEVIGDTVTYLLSDSGILQ